MPLCVSVSQWRFLLLPLLVVVVVVVAVIPNRMRSYHVIPAGSSVVAHSSLRASPSMRASIETRSGRLPKALISFALVVRSGHHARTIHNLNWSYLLRSCAAVNVGIFDQGPERHAILAWTLFRIAIWTGFAGLLHWRKWYWAL